ncbi:MAG: DUF2490 domain-containing protein [Bacteroidota bacterium]
MKKIIPYFLFLFCAASGNFAQRNDAAIWESITLEKRLTPKILLHLQQAARIAQNITQIQRTHYDIGITYKINKNISTSLNYRFINRFFTENGTSLRHRIHWNLALKTKIQPFVFIYRHRLQGQVNDFYSSEDGKISSYYSRSKLTVKYEFNKLSPYLAAELYTKIINWNTLQTNRYRLFGGFDYQLNKMNELELYYLIDKRFNEYNPLTNYVIGIGFTHRFY